MITHTIEIDNEIPDGYEEAFIRAVLMCKGIHSPVTVRLKVGIENNNAIFISNFLPGPQPDPKSRI